MRQARLENGFVAVAVFEGDLDSAIVEQFGGSFTGNFVHFVESEPCEADRRLAVFDIQGALHGAEGDFPEIKQRLPLITAVRVGAAQTGRQIGLVLGSVKRLVLGQASMKEVGGPIMIAQVSGQAVRLGIDRFLMFMAFFSISLAVLNLLPIPVLDGGHAMFLIAEGIRRKPLSAQLRMRLTQVGMLIVLAIMVLALSNDVLRFFR